MTAYTKMVNSVNTNQRIFSLSLPASGTIPQEKKNPAQGRALNLFFNSIDLPSSELKKQIWRFISL